MLGIADRSKILELFRLIFDGEQKIGIQHLRNMIDEGTEPTILLNDFLEIIYFHLEYYKVKLLLSEPMQSFLHL